VASISHRDRIGAGRKGFAGENFDAFRRLQQVGIEPQMDRKRPI
jgi:hypothetical protein